MRCPDCGAEMLQLFTSYVCEVCESGKTKTYSDDRDTVHAVEIDGIQFSYNGQAGRFGIYPINQIDKFLWILLFEDVYNVIRYKWLDFDDQTAVIGLPLDDPGSLDIKPHIINGKIVQLEFNGPKGRGFYLSINGYQRLKAFWTDMVATWPSDFLMRITS